MWRSGFNSVFAAALVVVITGRQAAAMSDQPGTAPSNQLSAKAAAILEEYNSAWQRFVIEWQKATTDAEREKIPKGVMPDRVVYARRALDLARAHPADPGAADAIAVSMQLIAQGLRNETVSLKSEGLDLLASHHLNSERTPAAFRWIVMSPSRHVEAFLHQAIEKSTSRYVRGRALLALADYFRYQSKFAGDRLKEEPNLRKKIEMEYDRDVIDALPDNADDELARAKSVYQQVIDQYADVKGPNGPLGEQAKNILYAFDHLAIGNKAPQIEGRTIDGKWMKLSDYQGKVVVLDFWGDW